MEKSGRPDLSGMIEELNYRVDFKVKSLHPGKWPSMGRQGGGYSFDRFERLSNFPDFRKIDFLATSRNPLANEPLVRVNKPVARIDLVMLADLSLSLSCGFSEPKLFQIAKLATLFGHTAYRFGDRFGFIAFDNKLLREFYYPPVRSANIGLQIGRALLDFQPNAPSTKLSIKDVEQFLPLKKSFVLLVSDFYLDPQSLGTILERVARHRVVPIILRHERERQWPRGLFGALRLKDSENAASRTVFFSSGIINDFERKSKQNEEEIRQIFHSHSVEPIILDEVTPDRLLEALDRSYG
ncbi:MAG: hypothetical protein CVU57_07325 [Deltaproteobacteria bacterium HGW-Deltaproteobacteria-15]|jgi:uncharacterized protein (DUF58 family)|nr:MAG: hypothetical protein CVU57_07325 [Deltaproteobacteria bacterium HGW-Deltaproteobacteria-15]